MLEGTTCANRHARERIVCYVSRHAGLYAEELIEISEQRASASENHAFVGHVCC